jgi:hypothetical protein
MPNAKKSTSSKSKSVKPKKGGMNDGNNQQGNQLNLRRAREVTPPNQGIPPLEEAPPLQPPQRPQIPANNLFNIDDWQRNQRLREHRLNRLTSDIPPPSPRTPGQGGSKSKGKGKGKSKNNKK